MKAIGRSGHPEALTFLEPYLIGEMRMDALHALGSLGTPAACQVLAEEYANGPDPNPLAERAIVGGLQALNHRDGYHCCKALKTVDVGSRSALSCY